MVIVGEYFLAYLSEFLDLFKVDRPSYFPTWRLCVAGDLVLPRVDCCMCTLYSVLYVWVYVVNGSLYER